MKRHFVFSFLFFVSLTSFGQSFSTLSYPVGAGANQLVVADFNGDNIPDLATTNNAANTVSILINNGDGTFRPELEFATGPAPFGLAAVDWNKDGKMDLVVLNSADSDHNVSILIGNGDGTFQPPHDIAGAPNANSMAVADFNHDGNPDVATSSNAPVNAVYVGLGDGNRGITAIKITANIGLAPQPPAYNPFLLAQIVAANFNGDSSTDLYYTECCNTFVIVQQGAFGWLTGNGDGTFTDHPPTGATVPPTDLSVIDINQDGLSDVIIPFFGCHEPCLGVSTAINNGDGTFRGGPGIGVGANSPGFLNGTYFDVDGDGLKDFVMTGDDFTFNFFTNMTLVIAKQNADGTFASGPDSEGNNSQQSTVVLNAPILGAPAVVVADFNHDGRPDLAMLSREDGGPVFVSLNTTLRNPCTVRTTDHTVTVCSPADGTVTLSPLHIVSHATSSTPVSVSQIYLDDKLVFQGNGGSIDKSLPLTPGSHHLQVKSWSNGQPFHSNFSVSIPEAIPATVPPCSESTNFIVNVCSPAQNATLDGPAHVLAAAKSSATITTMQIYLDNKEIFHSPSSTLIETDVPMDPGTHLLVIKAWDSTGRNFSTSRTVTRSPLF